MCRFIKCNSLIKDRNVEKTTVRETIIRIRKDLKQYDSTQIKTGTGYKEENNIKISW